MKITDTVTLGDARATAEGYLEANARTARTGVQMYRGSELGRPDLQTVAVYRDAGEVFCKRAVNTFSKIPVTLDHPPELITAGNWKDFAIGTTGDLAMRDGEYLKIGLKITDKSGVEAVMTGKRELSVGYETELVWKDGIAPDGTPYQAAQTAIVANHIAIVSQGRAGSLARIGDSLPWGAAPIPPNQQSKEFEMTDILKKVMVDGLEVSTTDAGAVAIAKLMNDVAVKATALTDAESAHAKSLAAKDAQIDDLKAKVLTDAALDEKVKLRGDLIAKAKAIHPAVVTDGKPDAEIRKAVVIAKIGDAAVKDKPDAYIDARFDILSEADPLKGKTIVADKGKVDIYTARDAELSNAWQTEKKGV